MQDAFYIVPLNRNNCAHVLIFEITTYQRVLMKMSDAPKNIICSGRYSKKVFRTVYQEGYRKSCSKRNDVISMS